MTEGDCAVEHATRVQLSLLPSTVENFQLSWNLMPPGDALPVSWCEQWPTTPQVRGQPHGQSTANTLPAAAEHVWVGMDQ